MASSDDIIRALLPVAESLDRIGIPYMICGSVASSVLGVARATLDVDLVAEMRLSQVDRFALDLAAEYYLDADMIREAIRRSRSFNVIHLPTMMKIDVFVLKQTAYDRTAFGRARLVELDEEEGRLFSMASPEDVILHKLLWFQMGEEVATRQWRDVLGVLRIQARQLDWDYLKHWAGNIGVSGLLERARSVDPEPGTEQT